MKTFFINPWIHDYLYSRTLIHVVKSTLQTLSFLHLPVISSVRGYHKYMDTERWFSAFFPSLFLSLSLSFFVILSLFLSRPLSLSLSLPFSLLPSFFLYPSLSLSPSLFLFLFLSLLSLSSLFFLPPLPSFSLIPSPLLSFFLFLPPVKIIMLLPKLKKIMRRSKS